MKKYLLTTAALALLSNTAFAADLMGEADRPAIDWTGAYVGLDLGGAWHDGSSETLTNVAIHSFDDFDDVLGGGGGLLAGIHAGYDVQYGNLVMGGVVEAALANIDETFDDGANDVLVESQIDYVAAAKVRFGYAVDRMLFYGTVGGAMTNYEIVVTDRIDDRTGAIDQTLYGYVLGGGAEYAMTENVSVRLDYSFHDFGSQRYDFNDVNIDFEDEDVGLTLQTFKLGISYRF